MYIFRLSVVACINKKPTATSVAKKFRVSEKTIRDIWSGRTWHEETLPHDLHRRPKKAVKTGRPLGRKDSAPRKRKLASSQESAALVNTKANLPSITERCEKGSCIINEVCIRDQRLLSFNKAEFGPPAHSKTFWRYQSKRSIPFAPTPSVQQQHSALKAIEDTKRNFPHHSLNCAVQAFSSGVHLEHESGTSNRFGQRFLFSQTQLPAIQPSMMPPPLSNTTVQQHFLPSLATLRSQFGDQFHGSQAFHPNPPPFARMSEGGGASTPTASPPNMVPSLWFPGSGAPSTAWPFVAAAAAANASIRPDPQPRAFGLPIPPPPDKAKALLLRLTPWRGR